MDSETNRNMEQIAQPGNNAVVDQQPRTPTSDRRSFLRTAAAGVTAAGILAATGKPEAAYAQAVNPRSPTPDPTAVAAEIKKIQDEAAARRVANNPPAPPSRTEPSQAQKPVEKPLNSDVDPKAWLAIGGVGTAVTIGTGVYLSRRGPIKRAWNKIFGRKSSHREQVPPSVLPVAPVTGVAQAPVASAVPEAAPAQPERQPVPAAAANIEFFDVVAADAELEDLIQRRAAQEPQPDQVPAAGTVEPAPAAPPPPVAPAPAAPPAAPAPGEASQRP